LDPISGAELKKGVEQSVLRHSSTTDRFAEKIMLAKAGELLRNTAQYGNWTQLCQNNDALAREMAQVLLDRHALLEQAKKGQPADWKVFDNLTEKLKSNHIFLFQSTELFNKYPYLIKPAQQIKPAQTINPQGPAPPRIKPLPQTAAIKTEKDHSLQSTSPVREPVSFSEGNLLVLSAQFKHYVLNNGLIGYGNADQLFLPLGEMARTLDFNIQVEAEKKSATGWFVSEERRFELDMTRNQVVSDGKEIDVPAGSILVAEQELYIDINQLSRWFPVDFKYDFSTQSVMVHPREKLAFQARIEREQAWRNIKGAQVSEPVFPRQPSEYEWISPPVVDLGISSAYTNGTPNDDGFKSGFYLLSKGDFGKMTSEIYLSGDDEEGLENSRLTLRRDDPDGNLLGPLKATSVMAGDIRTTDLPIIGGGETERGFGFGSEKLFRPGQFDTTFFEGNLPPGWDVEVYRNNVLLDTQRVGAEGRYSFNEIPLYYGKNEFRLMFYGPQGQEKIETRRIDVGTDLLQKGKGEYSVSVTQKDTILHDPEKTGHTMDEESLKLNAMYNYGLQKNLTVSAGLSSQEILETRHNYLNLGVKGNLEGMYLSGDYIHDTQDGDAIEMFAQTGLGDFDLNFRQRFYNDFIDDSGSGISDPVKSETSVSLFGQIDESRLLPMIPFTLTYKDTQKEHSRYSIFGSRVAANIKNINLNNYLQWTDISTVSGDSSVLDGSLQAITQSGDFRFRGGLDYEIDPDIEIKNVEVSSLYNINENLSSELVLKRDMKEDIDEGVFKLNFNDGNYILSPQVSYNSEDEFQAALSFSTSLGVKPRSGKLYSSSSGMADKGAVSVRVYNDKNNNQVFDKGDEAIKGASVKAVQSYQQADTDEEGVAFISMLQKSKPTDVVLDKDTLEDPFWEPSTPGSSITPRPGHTQQIDIPVVTTGEVDGTVLSYDKDGKEIPLPNVRVQLLDHTGKTVQEVRSEYDGFYYFPKVFPGKYSVRIASEDTRIADTEHPVLDVELTPEGTVASGLDLVLEPKTRTIAQSVDPGPIPLQPKPPQSNLPETRVTDSTAPAASAQMAEALEKVKAYIKHQIELEKTSAVENHPQEIARWSQVPSSEANVQIEKNMYQKGNPKYGVHLTSYRTPETAINGINDLLEKYKGILNHSNFTIRKVVLPKGKGVWYRVIAGAFAHEADARKMGDNIKMLSPYCKVVSVSENDDESGTFGVHLTSFRTRKKAVLSIDELKVQYPLLLRDQEFTIKDIDLGPGMGKWKRVMAGNFSDRAEAQRLSEKIKLQSPYCKAVSIEKDNEVGVHLASYRTLEKASNGLKQLQKKYAAVMADQDFFIRRVDLGNEKGIWYRIFAGSFEDRESDISLKHSLKKMKQYAEILPLSI